MTSVWKETKKINTQKHSTMQRNKAFSVYISGYFTRIENHWRALVNVALNLQVT